MAKNPELDVALAETITAEKAVEAELAQLRERRSKELAKVRTLITALEARQIADTSEVVKKRINKIIKESAEEGMLETNYGIHHPSMVLIKSLEADLVARGFEVSIIPDDDNSFVELVITWDK